MSARSLGIGSRAVLRALLPIETPAGTERARLAQLATLQRPEPRAVWLMLAVLGRRLPLPAEVESATRLARHDGTAALLVAIARDRRAHPARWLDPEVEVIDGATLVDVHDSATTRLSTGVQRLARGIADHWIPRGATLVGWSPSRTQLRTIAPEAWAARKRGRSLAGRGIVPWNGRYALAEVVTDTERSTRIHALAEFAGSRTLLVGADAIPLTTAETTGPRMPGVFAKYLAAASRMTVIAAISNTAAAEYEGWRSMLASGGIAGPEIVPVVLAAAGETPAPDKRADAERLLLSSDEDGWLPLVLSVGSHEPRKNHGAVLHAAEVLWREGHRFSLVFIGGNAWHSEEFRMRLAELQQAGRPVTSISGASDATLWWGYDLARLTVFPSVNEGFGLPVVESLAAGTPVVTSDYGSMAEIAEDGGCLLVDPRDDASVARGIRSLLVDDALHSRLSAEARGRAPRSWEKYSSELWQHLMG
jgi:glycosyltransferase involved in cell wall biosynthesis